MNFLIDGYPRPGAATFHSTTSLSGGDGTADRGRVLPGSVKPAAGVWIPPPSVNMLRASALCLSAFLGQDHHGTAAHTHTDTGAYIQARNEDTLKCRCLCIADTYTAINTHKRFTCIHVCRQSNMLCCLLLFSL